MLALIHRKIKEAITRLFLHFPMALARRKRGWHQSSWRDRRYSRRFDMRVCGGLETRYAFSPVTGDSIRGILSRLGPGQVVLLLEFLQPAWSKDLLFAVLSAGRGEKVRFLLDHGISEDKALACVVSGPVGERFFDIGHLSFASFDGRATSIVHA